MKASTDQFLKYSLGTLELIIQQFQGSWGGGVVDILYWLKLQKQFIKGVAKAF